MLADRMFLSMVQGDWGGRGLRGVEGARGHGARLPAFRRRRYMLRCVATTSSQNPHPRTHARLAARGDGISPPLRAKLYT